MMGISVKLRAELLSKVINILNLPNSLYYFFADTGIRTKFRLDFELEDLSVVLNCSRALSRSE